MNVHEPTVRRHLALVMHHVSKAEGLREAGADPAGEMAEAKRHLAMCANAFGCFLDEIEPRREAAQ